jgi:hypothetical protein
MTQALPLPPLEVLQKKFEYNPENGILTRKSNNQPAGYLTERGWLRVKVDNTHYRVHRIAWKMFYGEDPPVGLDIDHINRNRTDNRISNLRIVTRSDNVRNSRAGGGYPKAIMLVDSNGQARKYRSVKEAAQFNNIQPGNISKVLKGHRKTCGGFTAYYA